MSLNYNPLYPILVRDPRTIVQSGQQAYSVLQGGKNIFYKQFQCNSISTSSLTYTSPMPNGSTFTSLRVFHVLPMRLVMTGNVSGGLTTLLNKDADAPRQFPFSSICQTITLKINTSSFNINLAQLIHPLMHFDNGFHQRNSDFSMTPDYPDVCTEYETLIGDVRNPLGIFGNTPSQMMTRGGFQFVVVSNTATSAVVDLLICEPVILSPLYWSGHDKAALYNATSFDITFNFLQSIGARVWSHCAHPIPGNPAAISNITNITPYFNNFPGGGFSFNIGVPELLFTYIDPSEMQVLSPNIPITYNYYIVQDFAKTGSAVSPGATTLITSDSLQISTVPERIYIWVRQQRSDLYSSPTNTDTFFSIQNINITWNSENGKLSSATPYDLYEISRKNGLDLNYTEFSGIINTHNSMTLANPTTVQAGATGSLISLLWGVDITSSSMQNAVAGTLSQNQLTVQVLAQNNAAVTITPELWVVVIRPGTFTIPKISSSVTNDAPLSAQDVLNAQAEPLTISLDQIRHTQGGGSFLSDLKTFGKNLLDLAKESKIISTSLSAVPHPVGQIGATVARNLGFGEGEGSGEGSGDEMEGMGGRRRRRRRRGRGGCAYTKEDLKRMMM